MKGGIVIFSLVVVLLSSFVLADHRDDLPFCGDGVVETTAVWDEASSKYRCNSDLNKFTPCRGDPDNYPVGALCLHDGKAGLCLKEGVCWIGGDAFQGKKSRIVVMNKSVGFDDPVLIYIYDPGRQRFMRDAFVKQIINGKDHYLANFCNSQQWCAFINPEGSSLKGDKDGKWNGFVKQKPGNIRKVEDFSSWFEEEPSDEDKRHWWQTTIKKSRYISYFAFDTAGEYKLIFIDTVGNRVESESFFVCQNPEDCKPKTLKGKVEDGHGEPMLDMQVMLTQDPGVRIITYTDDDGEYTLEGEFDTGEDIVLTFTFRGENNAHGKRFEIRDKKAKDGSTLNDPTQPVFVSTFPFKVADHKDTINFLDDVDLFESFNAQSKDALDDLARTHFFAAKGMQFAEDELGVIMNKDAPYIVDAFANPRGSYYQGAFHSIFLEEGDSHWDDFDRPDNGDWHEFAHALMYAANFGDNFAFPQPHNGRFNWNHLGYVNPSTTDSLVEGFAVFMSSVMAKELDFNQKDDKPEIYRYGHSSTVRLDDHIKVWQDMGRREDMAAGAVLWNIYDGVGDNVQVPFKEMWNLLNRKEIRDMKDVYDAFKNAGHDVDQIFIDYGFFVDKNGDRTYNPGEEVGRAAHGGAVLVSYDLNKDGDYDGWPLDLPEGVWVLPDRFDPKVAPTTASDDVQRWGNADTDGDLDIAALHFTVDGEEYDSAAVDKDGDGDFGVITDLNNDSRGDLTEDPFWALPYLTRRNMVSFPEEQLDLKITDKDGETVNAQLTFSYEYPDKNKNYEYTVGYEQGDEIFLWVSEEATLTITAHAGKYEADELLITGEQFHENLFPGKNQGEHTFELPATKERLEKAADKADALDEEEKSSLWWLYVLLVLIAVFFVVKKKKK